MKYGANRGGLERESRLQLHRRAQAALSAERVSTGTLSVFRPCFIRGQSILPVWRDALLELRPSSSQTEAAP